MSELEYRLENGRIKWGDWTAADVRYVSDRGKDLVHRANSFNDLLAALKKCSEWNSLHENFSTELNRMVEEAIAKAEEWQ